MGMSEEQDARDNDEMMAAESKGHKFIELHLNHPERYMGRKEVKILGVKMLKGYVKGRSAMGIPDFNFSVMGGEIKFKLDRQKRAYVGYLFDDKEIGPGSGQVGYNRDILATHLGTGEFKIMDESVRKDAELRLKLIIAKREKEEEAAKARQEPIQPPNKKEVLQSVDDEIARLLKKKEEITKQEPNVPAKRGYNRRVKEEAPAEVPEPVATE
jgi:hypothetical protein